MEEVKKKEVKKKKALIVLLIISIALNILFLVLWAPTPYNSYDIKGTYSMGIEGEKNISLILFPEGKFIIQTSEYTVDIGRYEKLNQNNDLSQFDLKTKLDIYKLISDDGKIIAYIIYEDKNIIYLDFNTKENFVLKRIFSTPSYHKFEGEE